ncbi:MAG TPA: PIG-L family deacetylase [Terriglobales bacterium]|nr:PIG-L family deacetylase [Terriglobales bacterium]
MPKMILLLFALTTVAGQAAQAPSLPGPDPRYNADLLLVVAHPDDETGGVAGYLARAIYDHHRRVAVVFVNRGQSGGNAVGAEEGNALGSEREIEGRSALASFGIANVWFLDTPNVSSQNVMNSLERWGHGAVLEEVVRLVRLTRPEVILTWLPAFVAGENHADHQAAAVIATEAFDMAGDPAIFSEQLVRDHSGGQSGEGLLAWQPKKLYYYTDADDALDFDQDNPIPSPYRENFLDGAGPQYSLTDLPPSQHKSYAALSAQETSFYLTQEGRIGKEAVESNNFKDFEYPLRLIFGKSLVGGSVTGDVFEGIAPGSISWRSISLPDEDKVRGVSLELGGPWKFYQEFWKIHNIEHLADLLPVPEMAIRSDVGYLHFSLLIHNNTETPQEVTIRSALPEGWTDKSGYSSYSLAPGQTYPVRSVLAPFNTSKEAWREIKWSLQVNGHESSSVTMRLHMGAQGAMSP